MKQFYVVPINDDKFSLSLSPSALNVGSTYFVTYIPTDVTGQRIAEVSGSVSQRGYVVNATLNLARRSNPS